MIINPDRRGRTAGGRTTYRPIVQMEPDDFPPDSKYWLNTAMAEASKLRDRIGKEAYGAWVDSLPDKFTWKEFYEMVNSKTSSLEAASCSNNAPA